MTWFERDFDAVLERIRRQFSEPLTFRVFDDHTANRLGSETIATYTARSDRSTLPHGVNGDFDSATPIQETRIPLTDSTPPAVTEPSGVDAWFYSHNR